MVTTNDQSSLLYKLYLKRKTITWILILKYTVYICFNVSTVCLSKFVQDQLFKR